MTAGSSNERQLAGAAGAQMMRRSQHPLADDNEMAASLSRWENEGGASGGEDGWNSEILER